jgi:threonylcarbamoyladenosine tRNA methylthiotransferase MtaB
MALKRQLVEAGFREAAAGDESDIAVLNTCTVTATADAEVRQVIRRIHRRNPRCRILVTGCYAQRAPHEIATLEGVAWVVGNSHKHRVAEVLRAETPGDTEEGQGRVMVGEIAPEFHFAPAIPDDRTRPTLKVQDGCNARCSFCIIPSVRGPSRSLAPDAVVEEVRSLERRGYRELVLSGINLGSYGRDLGRSVDFVALLDRILGETAIARIRISSIEPMDVTPELIGLARREKRVAEHFHVPLQSGSDRILRLMNRRYWTEQYADRILAIREALPQAGIGADVMVGFPEETEHDHALTAEFVGRLPFTYLHIFPYSARPGTPAAARSGQVDGRVKRERARELQLRMAQKRQSFLSSQIGRTLSVLTLDEGAATERAALSSNYLKVSIPSPGLPPNVFVDVDVARVHDGTLYGFPRRGTE